MVEEEKKEEETQKPVAVNLIEESRTVTEQMKVENDRREVLIKREEELQSIKMLSGATTAGQPIKSPEELEKDKTQKLADEITNAFK